MLPPRFDRRSDYETGILIRGHLDAFGVDYASKRDGDFIYVKCPFHGSKSRSLWIHKGGRKAKCHNCGHETDWDGYAEKCGLPKLVSDGPGIDGEPCISMRFKPRGPDKPLVIPNTKPWPSGWRKLRHSFLRRIDAREWYDKKSGYNRILFFINVEDDIVGYTAGRKPGNYDPGDPKYRTSPGLDTGKVWFMLDRVPPQSKTIVLTEGPYDCLRLMQAGIPAVAVLGSNNWSNIKTDSMIMRRGLKKVVVASDGDEAGDKMWEIANDEMGDHLEVVRAHVPRGHDPGSVPFGWIRDLRNKVI